MTQAQKILLYSLGGLLLISIVVIIILIIKIKKLNPPATSTAGQPGTQPNVNTGITASEMPEGENRV